MPTALQAGLSALMQRWYRDAAQPSRETDYDTGQYDALTVCLSELQKVLTDCTGGVHMTDRALCSTCGGNGSVQIPGGVSLCETCHGEGWASGGALGALVDAVDAYLAVSGREDYAAVPVFIRLTQALRDAKAALGRG